MELKKIIELLDLSFDISDGFEVVGYNDKEKELLKFSMIVVI